MNKNFQSQVAGGNMTLAKNVNNNHKTANNNVSINRIRKESVIISFVVGFLASIVASVVFEYMIK